MIVRFLVSALALALATWLIPGIALQIPGKPGNLIEYYPTYSRLAFEKATGWDRFVKYLGTI